MHSLLLRPGSDNSISLWCKLRHTIDISNYWFWFPFWIIVSFDLRFLFFVTFTQPFCKRHYPAIVITKNKRRMFTVTCTRLYILLSFIEIIKASPLCVLWTRGHAYLLTQLYEIQTVEDPGFQKRGARIFFFFFLLFNRKGGTRHL